MKYTIGLLLLLSTHQAYAHKKAAPAPADPDGKCLNNGYPAGSYLRAAAHIVCQTGNRGSLGAGHFASLVQNLANQLQQNDANLASAQNAATQAQQATAVAQAAATAAQQAADAANQYAADTNAVYGNDVTSSDTALTSLGGNTATLLSSGANADPFAASFSTETPSFGTSNPFLGF